MKTVFYAYVENDLTLRFVNVQKVKTHLLALRGKTGEVTSAQKRNHRTLSQNAYYRGVVLPVIAEHCGYSGKAELDSLHARFAEMFLPKVGMLQIRKSTADLDTREMTGFIENIRRYAADELGVHVPSPGETVE